MNTDYFPKQLYHQLDGPLDYFRGAFKAASHNFSVSTEFDHLSSSSSTSEVADGIFAIKSEGPSFDLKAKHFISHVLVGALLLVPILNVFVFMGFESQSHEGITVDDLSIPQNNLDDLIVDADPEQPDVIENTSTVSQQPNSPTENTSLINQPVLPIENTQTNDSTKQSTPSDVPTPLLFRTNSNPKSRVVLEDSPSIHKLKARRNSRVSERALIFEQNKLNHQQQQIDAALPILDGERSNPVTIAEFKQIEASFTQDFFRLFPNETCKSEFAGLRRRQDSDESLGVLLDDSEYIKSLFLKTEGFTPEVRFKKANENLAALNDFIESQYPHLKDNFYILGNFKNDMQNKMDAIPYIHILDILFKASLEEFMQELNNYKFVLVQALEGEKTPVRIDTIEFQRTFKSPGSIMEKVDAYKIEAALLK